MFKRNGKVINLDQSQVIGGIQYLPSTLRFDESLRTLLGITEHPDIVKPNSEYYFINEKEDGTFTAVPKDINQIKDNLKQQIKKTAEGKILSILPEWKQRNCMARMLELQNKKLEKEVLTTAEENEYNSLKNVWNIVKVIRKASDANESIIDSCTEVTQLETVSSFYTWP